MAFCTFGDLNSSFASTYMAPLDVMETLGLLYVFPTIDILLLFMWLSHSKFLSKFRVHNLWFEIPASTNWHTKQFDRQFVFAEFSMACILTYMQIFSNRNQIRKTGKLLHKATVPIGTQQNQTLAAIKLNRPNVSQD